MIYREPLLDKLERKIGRFAIPNLMLYLVGVNALVWLADLILVRLGNTPLSAWIDFDRSLILSGQVWRVLTFVFVPYDSNILTLLISLYFYWMIGSSLEAVWGAFRFNVFYFSGILFTAACGMIFGDAVNIYLNTSLFLAYAILFPDNEILLFFVIPVKVKYLGILSAALLVFFLVTQPFFLKMLIVFSLLNLALFFWRDFFDLVRRLFRKWRR